MSPVSPTVSSPYQILLQTRAGRKRDYSSFRSNQDRVIKREFTAAETGSAWPAALIAVADGVSRCPDGGAIASWILHEKLEREPLFRQTGVDLGEQFRTRILEFHREFLQAFQDDVLMLESGCTLSAALLYGPQGIVIWSGDSPVYHFRESKGTFQSRSLIIPDVDGESGALTDCFSGVTAFSPGMRTVELEPGDMVLAATDGIMYSGRELAASVGREGFTEAWMDSICQKSFDTPRSDDMAIVAAKWQGPVRQAGPVLS